MLSINLEDDKYRYKLTIFGYGLFIGTLIAGPFTPLIPVWKLSSRNRVTPVSIHDPCGAIADFCGLSPISAELSPIPAVLRSCRDP